MNEVNEPKAQPEAVPSTAGLEITRDDWIDVARIVVISLLIGAALTFLMF
jgi:DNA polymerase elongation subunit (family B)